MYNIPNTSTWEANIQGVDKGEKIDGGAGGNLNLSAEQLTRRTQWLKDTVDAVNGTTVWQKKNASFTTVDGDRIFADTNSSSWTMTLPASPAFGEEIHIVDYAKTWKNHNLTIARNGNRINSLLEDLICDVSGCAFRLVYSDSSQGWIVC